MIALLVALAAYEHTPKEGVKFSDLCREVYEADQRLCDLAQEFNHLKSNWVRAGRTVRLPPFVQVFHELLPDADLRPVLDKMGAAIDRFRPAIRPLIELAHDAHGGPEARSGAPPKEIKAILDDVTNLLREARVALGRVQGVPQPAFHQLQTVEATLSDLATMGPDENAYDVFHVHQHAALAFEYLRSWADGRRARP